MSARDYAREAARARRQAEEASLRCRHCSHPAKDHDGDHRLGPRHFTCGECTTCYPLAEEPQDPPRSELHRRLVEVVWPAFSGGDPDPDDHAGAVAVVDALLAAPELLGLAYFAHLAGLDAGAVPLALQEVEDDGDEYPPQPCPDDPDGQHHVGCGCSW